MPGLFSQSGGGKSLRRGRIMLNSKVVSFSQKLEGGHAGYHCGLAVSYPRMIYYVTSPKLVVSVVSDWCQHDYIRLNNYSMRPSPARPEQSTDYSITRSTTHSLPLHGGLLLNLPSDISPCPGVPSPGVVFEAQDWAPTLWPAFFKPLQVQGVMASLLAYVPLEEVEPLRTAEGFKTYAVWQAYPVLKNFYTQYGESDVCLTKASEVSIKYHWDLDESVKSGYRQDAHISSSVRLL